LTTPPVITALYAGALALLALTLAANAARTRGKYGVGLGDGGKPELLQAIRMHGNFIENAPLALVVLLALELTATAAWTIHALGGALVIGRILHAWGLSRSADRSFGRAAGTVLTWTMIGLAGALALARGIGL
jgi:uncharacterized membrane protein YecN with MAPEG domain